jgi:hypothetical protein
VPETSLALDAFATGQHCSGTVPRETPADKPLDTLHTLLATARDLAQMLAEDPELERLVRAFRQFPERDRDVILQVIEKDAAWTAIVAKTAAETGITVTPNPHASLYVHVLNHVTNPPLAPEAPPRDADVIRLGVATFVDLVPLFLQPGVRAQWTAAGEDIARGADAERRALALELVRAVEAVILGADRTTSGT